MQGLYHPQDNKKKAIWPCSWPTQSQRQAGPGPYTIAPFAPNPPLGEPRPGPRFHYPVPVWWPVRMKNVCYPRSSSLIRPLAGLPFNHVQVRLSVTWVTERNNRSPLFVCGFISKPSEKRKKRVLGGGTRTMIADALFYFNFSENCETLRRQGRGYCSHHCCVGR